MTQEVSAAVHSVGKHLKGAAHFRGASRFFVEIILLYIFSLMLIRFRRCWCH